MPSKPGEPGPGSQRRSPAPPWLRGLRFRSTRNQCDATLIFVTPPKWAPTARQHRDGVKMESPGRRGPEPGLSGFLGGTCGAGGITAPRQLGRTSEVIYNVKNKAPARTRAGLDGNVGVGQCGAAMSHERTVCRQCRGPLIEIDHFGERLIGCVECNRWTWRGSKASSPFLELPEKEIQALHNLSDSRHKAEDIEP
jgi:hypothetical protein